MNPLISLCLIAGNCEEYIERCLASFAPIADEIIVVRAIGSLAPDRTLDIAREKFGAITAEYKNAPDKEDWPHVDDFAKARQMSFDMARGDYCFWCDTDDVLEGDPEFIRESARIADFDYYILPYRILGLGVEVPRERLIRRGIGKWEYPVHETFVFDSLKATGAKEERVVVVHRPHLSKSGSNERNLRILRGIPEDEMHPGLLYHLHGELIGMNDIENACRVAEKALRHPDIGRPERYELLLTMAKTANDPNTRMSLLHGAYMADPTRREALGVLAGTSMDLGNYEDALCYAQQMRATPEPKEKPWNHRLGFHGYIGDDIYQQALRVNGLADTAEQLRKQALAKAGGPTITLIHATRGRAQKAVLARKVWFDMADHPERIEHIFIFDSDDPESMALKRFHHSIISPGGGCVAAWNHGAVMANAQVLVQLSDDWLPCAKWDSLILERIADVNQPRVLAISDGIRDDDLICMAICTRAYWRQDHYLFHPSFTGVYSDNHFTEVAYGRKQVIRARDIVFAHRHPFADEAQWDETYVRQNSKEQYEKGRRILDRIHTGRDWSSVPSYCNFHAFYKHVAAKLEDGDRIAELGTWLGHSITFLAQSLQDLGKNNVKLYAVDTFKGEVGEQEHARIVAEHGGSIRSAFEANIERCGVAPMIEIIEGNSAQSASVVPDGSLAFVFVDAAHDYDSVKRDIDAWTPKVKPGGMIAGHDADHHAVAKAVRDKWPDAVIVGPLWFVAL